MKFSDRANRFDKKHPYISAGIVSFFCSLIVWLGGLRIIMELNLDGRGGPAPTASWIAFSLAITIAIWASVLGATKEALKREQK